MLQTEKRAAYSLALVYGFRMLGLFMILPVFSLYADKYEGVSPTLMGLAIGIYGLTQGLFQLPFGFLSDRYGRKKLILIGLTVFFVGSLIAASANTINEIILGRAFQGMGAIAAVVMALAADLSREEVRVKMMAIIGMSIGCSFVIAMIIGPVLVARFGLDFLFVTSAVLAIAGMFIVGFITPNPTRSRFHRDTQLSFESLAEIIKNKTLIKLDIGVFVIHMVLSATFVVFPLMLRDQFSIDIASHWKTYIGVFACSIVFMIPMIVIAEKKHKVKLSIIVAGFLLCLALVGLLVGVNYGLTFLIMILYFAGFNFLEAIMPSQISRIAPAGLKGTAMGIFSSCQFFGAFAGGLLGGFLYGFGGEKSLFTVLIVIMLVWLFLLLGYSAPKPSITRTYSIGKMSQASRFQLEQLLYQVSSVSEVSVFERDEVLCLKVEKKFDEVEVNRLIERYKA